MFALILHIELLTQAHYRESIEPDSALSPLFKDAFLFHWKEESQHAIMDELEWRRFDATLTGEERDAAVDEFIELVCAVDRIPQAQAAADARHFAATRGRVLYNDEMRVLVDGILRAYRWQYTLTGAQHPHFRKVLCELIDENEVQRIRSALVNLN